MTLQKRLARLFRIQPGSRDGYDQLQREALLDLLTYLMYADSRIAVEEEQLIEGRARTFDWEGEADLEDYLDAAVDRVRALEGSPHAAEAFLDGVRSRLRTPAARQNAINLCHGLIQADGRFDPEELELFQQIIGKLA